ncbi:sushi repeat-containing protein SRPX2 [Engraulis encrasicolus]|uniref:sushi repeat-containing protein SRPX2 n=1 Tax=Engraulis encrasicolus TaxID=184585 RepID=UPI002FD4400B
MEKLLIILFFEAHFVCWIHGTNTEVTSYDPYNEVVHEEEEVYYTPQLDYNNPHWCHRLRLPNGDVSCSSPRSRNHYGSLGTRCELSCDRGHKLVGRYSVHCMDNRRWSGTGYCRKIRCHVLPVIQYGTFHCSDSVMVDSRCEYYCNPGYRLEGDHARVCQDDGSWTGGDPICADHEPPKIRCPESKVKVADPGELTARVYWNRPYTTDTSGKTLDLMRVGPVSGSTFEEGIHIIRYRVYDQARNRAACKFTVQVEVRKCPALKPPLHGYLTCSSDRSNYGATCEYHCDSGYELSGLAIRVCRSDRSWSDEPPTCLLMQIKTDVKTAAALMDQFYEKRRLLIVSTPNVAHPYYKIQNMMLQKANCGLDLRHVTVVELLGVEPRQVGRIKGQFLDSQVIDGLRQVFQISPSHYSMVLVDAEGVDRERFRNPANSMELYAYIEDYLMDDDERERLETTRDMCE